MPEIDFTQLHQDIKHWAQELGFNDAAIADIDLKLDNDRYLTWLSQEFHGNMEYMKRNANLRANPDQLVSNVKRVIVVSMNYLPITPTMKDVASQSETAYIARYALGRNYHKLIRKKLNTLAKKITERTIDHGYRAFCDSAPILERALAAKSGIGWVGKNTLIMNRQHGSWFFLGEILTDLPLPLDSAISSHCGSCTACIDICPTKAIIKPYILDARRCISYLTIEHKGSIDENLRPLMGNRIFGCDDCQIICPWNKFAQLTTIKDFSPRHSLDCATLIDLFNWSEQDFANNTEGSTIRRAGYTSWLRNIAISLGNAKTTPNVILALQARANHTNEIVREHVVWALTQHASA